MRRALLLFVLAAAWTARADLVKDILHADTNADRACLVETNGGMTPALLDALAAELKTVRRALKPPQLRDLGSFVEQHAREQRAWLPLAKALAAIGTSWFNERQFSQAEPYDREALEIARLAGDDPMIADELQALAIYATRRNEPAEALELLGEASEHTSDPRTVAYIQNAAAVAERTRGNLAGALAELRKARAAFEKLGDAEAVAGVTNNLGNNALQLGDLDEARKWFEEALARADKANNDRIRAYALNNLGIIAQRRNELSRAQSYFERSLAIKERLNDPSGVAGAYVNLGEIARLRGRRVEAFRAYMKSWALAQSIGDRTQGAIVEVDAALLAQQNGDRHLALYLAGRALAAARELPQIAAAAASVRGDALRALGRKKEARAEYAEGIALVEAERRQAGGTEQQRTRFLEDRLNPYLGIVSLLAASEPKEALRHAELAKARVLLDLFQRENDSLAKPATLRAGSAAIEFVVTPARTYVFVVTRDAVRVRGVGIRGDELAREVKSLRERIAQRDLGFDSASATFFARLLGGVWPMLRDVRELIIIPDGALWELPFQALVADDGRYLAEHAALAYAPSLTALAEMRRLTASNGAAPLALLAFGNPPAAGLPEAERQLGAIGRLYPQRRVYTGEAATEQRLRAEIAEARVVHIATHGVLNDQNPLYSYLLFAASGRDDGLLEGREIARLPLRSDLVVLSACDSARGRTRQGEGVIGMAWALFLAGCPSTVVSQWSIDSASAARMMIGFHQRLREGATKSAALQQASLALLKQPKTRHPFYWAGFVVIGDDTPLIAGR